MGNFKIIYFALVLFLQVQYCIAQDLKAGDVSFNLKSLNETDSIRLSGYISDCGEFGGHWEFIVLKKISDVLSASFNQEPPCSTLVTHIPDSLKQENDSISEKKNSLHIKPEIKITEQEIVLFQNYFKEFPEIGKNCGNSYSNARSE